MRGLSSTAGSCVTTAPARGSSTDHEPTHLASARRSTSASTASRPSRPSATSPPAGRRPDAGAGVAPGSPPASSRPPSPWPAGRCRSAAGRTSPSTQPAVATQAPAPAASLSSLVVEPGLGSDRRLHDAGHPVVGHGVRQPRAGVHRSRRPALDRPRGDGRALDRGPARSARRRASYAVETTGWASDDGTFGADGPVWSFCTSRTASPGARELDEAGRWTTDFAAWVDDAVAQEGQRPRLRREPRASFADDRSRTRWCPAPACEIVAQREDVDIGDRPRHARQTVAEVRIERADLVRAGGRQADTVGTPTTRPTTRRPSGATRPRRLPRASSPRRSGTDLVSRDDASYVEFVAAAQDRLRRIAYAVCADDSRAEDVLQEALVKLYLAWPRVRDARRRGGVRAPDHRQRRPRRPTPALAPAPGPR